MTVGEVVEEYEPNPHLMVILYNFEQISIISLQVSLEMGVYVGIEEGESVTKELLERETEPVMVGVLLLTSIPTTFAVRDEVAENVAAV